MDGFAAEGVPFRVEVPRLVLPESFESVDVERYAIAFGGFEAKGAVKGSLGEHAKLSGEVESNRFDLRALLASVGIEAPKTTDPKALGKIGFSGTWAFDDGAIRVTPLVFDLDDTHFTGSFSRTAGENATGQFALSGSSLDIARYIPPADPNSEPFVMPTAALKALRFRGEIRLVHATLDDIDMKDVVVRLLLDEQGLRSVPATAAPTP